MEKTQLQPKNQADRIKAWQFQPGKSGNPGGKPKGTQSLKIYARNYLLSLSDEEKLKYMKGMDKKDIWEMGEGKAKQDLDIQGEVITRWLRWMMVYWLIKLFSKYKIKGIRAGLFCEDYVALNDRHLTKIKFEFPDC